MHILIGKERNIIKLLRIITCNVNPGKIKKKSQKVKFALITKSFK